LSGADPAFTGVVIHRFVIAGVGVGANGQESLPGDPHRRVYNTGGSKR